MAEINKEQGMQLTLRDDKMRKASELLSQVSHLRAEASRLERDYITSKFLDNGIQVGKTLVKHKQSGDVGVINICSNTSPSQVGTISMYWWPKQYTQLAIGLSFWRAGLFPYTKKGKISEIESKATKTRYTDDIDEFIGMFEIVPEEKEHETGRNDKKA